MNTPAERQELLGLSRDELEGFFAGLGEKPFRARQLLQWLHRRGITDFGEMTDLAKSLRSALGLTASVSLPRVISRHQSADGTVKWLTGFNRNLTAAEIIGQVWLAQQELEPRPNGDPAVTNVVFMGMGEPLANYRNVVTALRLLIDDYAYGLSRRRVTVSTSGLVPQMRRLGAECNVSLAVSLHAPDDELRNRLVPINKMHPIAELLDACWDYAAARSNRHITFEYVMLDGVNDSPAHADRLAKLLRGRPAKVNLIPFNPFPGIEFRRSPAGRIDDFRDRLRGRGIVATVRRTRGDDIDAACGQLAGQVTDRVRIRLSEKPVRRALSGG